MISWSAAYIGLPWRDHGRDRAGCDCWGLVRLVYREQLGIDLPSHDDYATADDGRVVARLVEGGRGDGGWIEITEPQPFDVAVFRMASWASHVGLVVAAPAMLHMRGGAAKVENLTSALWSSRLVGIWRHPLRSGFETT
jgi:cell wall-associated NlpC family hydrolase